MSQPALYWLVGVNLLTLALFGWDKHCARAKRRRVPEARLLWLSALGGSPAALIARPLFRHKTRKQPFSAWLWVIVVAQAAIAAWGVTRL
ncbi:DUF1294 domain-containing protein [Novosphingobium ovatum]|uniref:DUF1294 domain-containing protein n=1 Tax=Novosphingobium ovatum TaxID=1908523 RepID=UPI0029FF0EE8|nr:DUF1294 domain-containing protein [Novosphingobium ovatum]